MQKVKLPHQLDPSKCALKRLSYQGVILAAQFQRLNEAVVAVIGEAQVALEFRKDEQGLVCMDGRCSVEVELNCQRCNENFSELLSAEFTYSPVKSEADIAELPDAYEPLELNEYNEFEVKALIEDELILALPIIALHDEAVCKASQDKMQWGEIAEEDSKPNPFAVLKDLKRN